MEIYERTDRCSKLTSFPSSGGTVPEKRFPSKPLKVEFSLRFKQGQGKKTFSISKKECISTSVLLCLCMCLCVCVRERERGQNIQELKGGNVPKEFWNWT